MSTFRHVAGELQHDGQLLARADAEWLLDLFREEYRAARDARNLGAQERALKKSDQLAAALSLQDQWARASGVRTLRP